MTGRAMTVALVTCLAAVAVSVSAGEVTGFTLIDAHNDLNCEDWRDRQTMWNQTRHALAFFREHVPFAETKPADD